MKTFFGDRQSGKTTRAIWYCLKHNYTLVFKSQEEANCFKPRFDSLKTATMRQLLMPGYFIGTKLSARVVLEESCFGSPEIFSLLSSEKIQVEGIVLPIRNKKFFSFYK